MIIQEDRHVFVVRYSFFKRILAIFVFLIAVLFGVYCMMLKMLIFIVFGILIIFVSIFRIIDVIFFDCLEINDTQLIKKWFIFGYKEIKIDELNVSCSSYIWDKSLMFWNKNSFKITFFYMRVETYFFKNKTFDDIKNLFILKKIINGNEKSWQSSKKQNLFRRIFMRRK